MRITWGAMVLAVAVVAAGASRHVTTVHAAGGGQAAPTVDQFPALMKTISGGAQAARMKMMSNDLAGAAKDAQAIATAFGDVEKFFASKNKSDAVGWAQTGRTAATAAAGALTGGDAMKATTELGNMQATCKQCHGAYREPGATQGTFKFKEGSI